jgi:transposase InsO family protein
VEPAQIHVEGICAARVLSYVHRDNHTKQTTDLNVCVSNTQEATHKLQTPHCKKGELKQGYGSDPNQCVGTVMLMLANFSDEELSVTKATTLGIAQEVSENLLVTLKEQEEGNSNSEYLFGIQEGQEPTGFKCQKYLEEKLSHLNSSERAVIEPVLLRYSNIFHDDESNDFKSTDVVEHRIITGDAQPIRKAQYRVPFALREEMESQVQDMLKKGVIRESNSPWSAPVILVPKKSTDGKPKYRFCVDFRALNAVTKFDSYPLPRFEETTSTLAGSKYFSVLDCYSGFWQIKICEEDKEKTAFTVPSGHYEFNRLSYGLSNSPASFQRLVDVVLKNLTGTECWVFIDDVIVYAKTAEEHAQRLANVLERFERANLQLQPEKCEFAKDQVYYLGHVISSKGIEASPDKVKAIQEYPVPKTVKEVRAFLGLASYYRRLVQGFAQIAKPLTQLTRKDEKFEWNCQCQNAFDELKHKLSTTPVLAYPDFELPFILTTDASKIAVAAVLSQVQEGIERPIAYASRQLNKAEQAYSASESELLAVVWATKYFRCYLYGRKFLVRTDHSALTFLHKFADNNSRLMRWSLRLAEFDFVVEHIPGRKVAHVDALSRHVGLVEESLMPTKQEVIEAQLNDSFCKRQKVNNFTSTSEFFQDTEGALYRRGENGKALLVIPETLIERVISCNHSSVFAAHPGSARTHDLIALKYWWPKMRKTIEDFVTRCDSCQRRKGAHEFKAPLGDVEEPNEPFRVTSMDITGPYPLTPRKNKYLLTFIDHFTRYAEAFPIPDQTAETCARVYATQIITRHGTGSTLITDQGRSFVSSFFKETCKILRVKKVQTTPYHPISNGVIERFHRTLHDGLSHFIDSNGTNWDLVVPFFLMAYRATPHSTTKYSPFYLLHGREMNLPTQDDLEAKLSAEAQSSEHSTKLENLKSCLKKAYEIVRTNNQQSHRQNKKYYDKKAKERKFNVEDLVYLFSPARKPGKCQKFKRVWQGPFKVLEKISDLNYRIIDRKGRDWIVHVNRLKKSGDQKGWKPVKQTKRKESKKDNKEEIQEEEEKILSRPIVEEGIDETRVDVEPREPQTPLATEEPAQTATPLRISPPERGTSETIGTQAQEISDSVRRDPNYEPSSSPRSRRELDTTPHGPPLTRSRTRRYNME